MIKGAIFDADGTLLDSMHIWSEVGARYLKNLGKIPERGLEKVIFSMTLEESSSYIKEKYALSQSVEEIKSGILREIETFYKYEITLKKGVAEFIKKLYQHKIPMVIATSSDRELVTVALKRLNINHYFTEIFTCSEMGTSKHKPEIYLKAAKSIDVKAEETAVFEDVLFAIRTAKDAGFITVAVEDNASVADREEIKATADFYITDFSDFKFIMMKKNKEVGL